MVLNSFVMSKVRLYRYSPDFNFRSGKVSVLGLVVFVHDFDNVSWRARHGRNPTGELFYVLNSNACCLYVCRYDLFNY